MNKYDEHNINIALYHCTIEQPHLFTQHEIDFYSKYYNAYQKIVQKRQQQCIKIDDMVNS